MPLAPVTTKAVKYQGCPANCRHIVFVKPSGQDVAALLRVDPTWAVSLFVEEEFHRFFMVASSPDDQQLRIERWLPRHAPAVLEAADQAAQTAALGGLHAGISTPAELADAAVAQLTASDTPIAVPARTLALTPMAAPVPASPNPRIKRGDYMFLALGATPTLRCLVKGPLENTSLKTKGTEGELVAAFRHVDHREAYFLFSQGANYLLERLQFWGSRYHRAEATSPQGPFGGSTTEDIVIAMAPNLAPDQP
jgi:hypothetical protein